mgnify:CR=1 FL=1
MTSLSEFVTILGKDANTMTQDEIESSFALYNTVFDVAFDKFLKNKKRIIQNSSEKC